jgi:hypothetical protein
MRWVLATSLAFAFVGCAQAPPVATANEAIEEGASPAALLAPELDRLRAAFAAEVPKHSSLEPEQARGMIERARAILADNAVVLERPQLIIVVDRNPAAQDLALVLAQPRGAWSIIGTTKISTGQSGRFDHYITPIGVFFHTDAILGYRAEGTYNENGIRGLGTKGMRVWDFGWQNAAKGWRADGERGDIRLMMHATDPTALEPRLGHAASKGCVRIPSALNSFLDRHGVLDVDYEHAALTDARYRGLLRPDRAASSAAGDAMVVVDSSEPLSRRCTQRSCNEGAPKEVVTKVHPKKL